MRNTDQANLLISTGKSSLLYVSVKSYYSFRLYMK